MFRSERGAIFNDNRTERYVLWNIWQVHAPLVLFIGLNPSTADECADDPTTKRLYHHACKWGFGGLVVMNCFSTIEKYPKNLKYCGHWATNLLYLDKVEPFCDEVVFMWGRSELVKKLGRDVFFKNRFKNAKQMGSNMDGSPKHPLYLPYSVQLIDFE